MSFEKANYDCAIIGGGVIGLALAYELGRNGRRVCVVDRGEPGREASWAGAGIIPPGAASACADPLEQLIADGSRLHVQWAARLLEETGIDTGYRPCGGLYVARSEIELDEHRQEADRLARLGVEVRWVSRNEIDEAEPAVAGTTLGGFVLPGESQIRNPWFLKALLAACRRHGVDVVPNAAVESVTVRGDRIATAQTRQGSLTASAYCLAAGCWTGAVAGTFGARLDIAPRRGQIVLLKADTPPLQRIVNHGLRYLVGRDDGRVLVGSTMERAGFDRSTTAGGIEGLLRFVLELAPLLASCAVERTWAGLRPESADGLPLLGRVPHLENAWIASGHFRNGLTLSTVTAEQMARLMCGLPPTLDLAPYSPVRFLEQSAVGGPTPRPPLATRGA